MSESSVCLLFLRVYVRKGKNKEKHNLLGQNTNVTIQKVGNKTRVSTYRHELAVILHLHEHSEAGHVITLTHSVGAVAHAQFTAVF